MNRNVVITGANRGIGLALTRYYKNNGDNVFAICRTASAALLDLNTTILDGVDLADGDVIRKLPKRLREVPIDILINNAGVYGKELLGKIDYEKVQQLFNVNAIAPLRVTESLLDNLGNGSKVALITSRMGSVADNSSGRGYDYRMSKAALNMAGKTLAVDLHEEGIAVAVLHPGFVQTDMVGGYGDISADIAAEQLVLRIEELDLSSSGTFWHSNGDILPW